VAKELDVIGATLQTLKLAYGAVRECEPYRRDPYPISYEFIADGGRVEATLLEGKCLHAMVAYERAPVDNVVQEKLALFSGLESWVERSTRDSQFVIYFPLFDPRQCRFFAEVQRDVKLGELVLWLSARDYPQMLKAYRAEQRGA
jgi:hypothetical protein